MTLVACPQFKRVLHHQGERCGHL